MNYPENMDTEAETPKLNRRALGAVAFVLLGATAVYAVQTFDVSPAFVLLALAGCVGWGVASCVRFVKRERSREAAAS